MSASSEASSLFGNGPRLAALRESQKPEDIDKETDAGEASCPASAICVPGPAGTGGRVPFSRRQQ